MIDDPWFYVAATVALLIVGISKGGFGGGLGVVGVPLMSLTISPLTAAAIMLPILCLMDLFSVRAYRRKWDPVNLRILIPAAMVGIAIATVTFKYVDVTFTKLLVGGIAVSFTLDFWLRVLRRKVQGPPQDPSILRGGFWGALSGFTSFIAHAAGPPLSVYMLPQQLNRTVLVGTTVIFFTVVNYVKVLPYAWLGQFDTGNLLTSLVLAPLAPIGVTLGVWLHHRISDLIFYRVCYLLLLLTGLKLLWDVVEPLL